jgi:calcineurin-like phosphoesterase family protein
VENSIGWLHITDLHCGQQRQSALWPTLREEVFDDLARMYETCGPWDLVLFTGDLTMHGTTREFASMTEELHRLWEFLNDLGCNPALLSVPGNHDLVRPTKAADAELVMALQTDDRAAESFWLGKKRTQKQIIERAFKPYGEWVRSREFPRTEIWNEGFLPGDYSATVQSGALKLGIVGLNSAYLQLAGGDFNGRLAVAPQQLHAACRGDAPEWLSAHTAALLLTHHPPSWFSESSQFYSEVAPPKRFLAHLFGHMHVGATRVFANGGATPRREIQGVSLFGLEEHADGTDQRIHGYNAGRLTLVEQDLHLSFWPRVATLGQGGHRRLGPDTDFDLDRDQAVQETIRMDCPRNDRIRSRSLSPELMDELSRLNRKIKVLTEEQYRIIEFLSGHSRAVIRGCAGSGKTLVAIEKAVRLDRAGLSTLMLCHNPFLANWLKDVTRSTRVLVRDFTGWVKSLMGEEISPIDQWTHWEEPSDDDILKAMLALQAGGQKFDAIIVDEGQDFRREWWQLVESALRVRDASQLYVFLDQHQELAGGRNVPNLPEPVTLSRNCRNAGKIYEVVRKFAHCVPEPELSLSGHGHVKSWRYGNPEEARSSVRQAIREAKSAMPNGNVVVITSEPLPGSSILNNLAVELSAVVSWKDAVRQNLAIISRQLRPKGVDLPQLSEAAFPSEDDIANVGAFASKVAVRLRADDRPNHAAVARLKWRIDGKKLRLLGPDLKGTAVERLGTEARRGGGPARALLAFFMSPAWTDGIPVPSVAKIQSHAPPTSPLVLPLHSIGTFKGLEADGVILLLQADNAPAKRESIGRFISNPIYVATSRARVLLHIVQQEGPAAVA